MRTLTELAASAATGKTVITAISGMAGSGKTAIAVHWAHQAAQHFPDGQLAVNLRGFDPSGTPVTPAEAVRAFLDALGVTAAQLPVGLEEQAALYRSLLAGKRVLLLLDNARDEEHVRPLLPGGPGSLVVITSRTRLTGLAATDGARQLTLGLLTREETTELLTRHLGAARMAAAPAAVDELVARSAGLALAASILAARAAGTAHSLTALAAEVRGERERLDAMETGDGPTDLRVVFSWSCRYLSPRAARVFRLLGLHPGPDVALAAVASLAGIPPRDARAAMNELSRAHLVTEPVPAEFAVHDLLRDYAAELAEAAETSAARHAAAHRVLDHYLHSARNCAQAAGRVPQADEVRLSPPPADVTLERFAAPRAALEWFTANQPLLTAVTAWAADRGFDSHCWQLPSVLRGLFDQGAYWQAMADTHQLALQAARRLEDRLAQGVAIRALGYACGRMGRYGQAVRHFQAAAEIFRSAGTARDRATSHRGLAWVLGMSGRHDEAMAHAQRAMDLTRDASLADQAHALNMVGRCHAYLGAYQVAVLTCGQALALHQQEGNRMGQAEAWYSLGLAHQGAGQHDESARAYQQGLQLFGELGDRHYIGETLAGLGDARQALGDSAQAVSLWQEALGILADIGHPDTDRIRAQLGGAVPALS